MLMIRLQRIGRKNDPSFRVVVVDSHQGPKSGKYVDLIGSHNPKTHTTSVDAERAKHWIGKGAQVSDTMHNILVSQGVIEGKKINVLPKKSPIVKDDSSQEIASEDVKPEAEAAEDKEEKKEETAVVEEGAEEKTPEEDKADTEEEKKEVA